MITSDLEEMTTDKIPWDGTGCWSPVFPANCCDMALASNIAVSVLIGLIDKTFEGNIGMVFERKYSELGVFEGYEKVCEF